MYQQLSLFSLSSDSENVSLPESSSDTKRQAIQRFLNNSKEAIACINTYSPGRRLTEYYRLSFRLIYKIDQMVKLVVILLKNLISLHQVINIQEKPFSVLEN